MRTAYLFLILVFFASQNAFAQEIPPKREFRGIWVASVANIDFPLGKGYTPEKFEGEWESLLDQFKEAGLNAVFAQVRPTGDALYPSRIVPWSQYLSGKPGEPMKAGYDPMAAMIKSTHGRNLEFHAWLNPYRASMDTITANLAKTHPYHVHPDWFVKYGGKLYFNPAKPEVRDYITEVVLEILMNYDVDGIHFDDYFYMNAKAAGVAVLEAFDEAGVELPLLISGTITDRSGRTLSGQTPEAFWYSMRHLKPFAIGLNCALGAEAMRPYIAEIAAVADTLVMAYPNAGLPNAMGEYDESPHDMSCQMEPWAEQGLVNIVGGCCGSTPEHIAEIKAHVGKHPPRVPASPPVKMRLSGLEPFVHG